MCREVGLVGVHPLPLFRRPFTKLLVIAQCICAAVAYNILSSLADDVRLLTSFCLPKE